MLRSLLVVLLISFVLSGLSMFYSINVYCNETTFAVHELKCKPGEVLYTARGFPIAFIPVLSVMNALGFIGNAFVFFAVVLILLILTKRIKI